ncbi:unnamed protein product [Rotaria sordida]|uniref:Uncharacterized protein n=2 Tax=Rotaria sordida TaxID=392033 RepID=A0A813R9B7_9BILA|nr:unnamed protein product [Rotaria sordida]
MILSFYSNWMPYKNQHTTVINTDKIAKKLEAAYGIKSGSIRIRTIVINNGKTNINDRRHKLYGKNHELPRCDQLGSIGSIVEIAMNIIYPARCGISRSCKKEFANVIQARIAAHISSILLKFKFADGSYSKLELTRCQKATDSSLNSLLRLRRAPATTTAKATTTKATTTKATTAKATTTKATTAKAITTRVTTAKATTAKATTAKATTAKATTTKATTAKATTTKATTPKAITTRVTAAKATTAKATTAKATTAKATTVKATTAKVIATASATTAGTTTQGKQLYVP